MNASAVIPQSKSHPDWLTIVAIAVIAAIFTIWFHESTHAITCLLTGGSVKEYSALYVLCETASPWQLKVTDASASLANLVIALLLIIPFNKAIAKSGAWKLILWLLITLNYLWGAGYWLFSGFADIGDWANVIAGWEPAWLWRIMMIVLGTGTFLFAIWYSLKLLGRIIGGTAPEQYKRATRLSLLVYFSALGVVLLTGIMNPLGMLSLPVTASIMGVCGAFSPFLWMTQWFKSDMFPKTPGDSLAIPRNWPLIVVALSSIILYSFVLGRTITF